MPRIDIDENRPVGLDGNQQLEREVAPVLPHGARYTPLNSAPEAWGVFGRERVRFLRWQKAGTERLKFLVRGLDT